MRLAEVFASRGRRTAALAGPGGLAMIILIVAVLTQWTSGGVPRSAGPVVTPTPTPSAETVPTPASTCVGSANAPGASDPWGGCWPGPQNTGYPKGAAGDARTPVTLTAYDGPTTISSCGVVIEAKIIPVDLVVTAGNGSHSPDKPCVTIKNSLIKGVVHTDAPSYGPVVISDSEVAVPDLSWWENVGRYNVFATRINSHGSEGVIKCASYCSVTDSWIHGMRLGGEYHYNAVGGNGIEPKDGYFTVQHNWTSCGDWASSDKAPGADAGCSAVIGFYGDFAPIRNVHIARNYLDGMRIDHAIPDAKTRQPGFCLNPGYYPGKPHPAPESMIIRDNVFGRGSSGTCGVFGPANSLNAAGSPKNNVWEANRYTDGEQIPRPVE